MIPPVAKKKAKREYRRLCSVKSKKQAAYETIAGLRALGWSISVRSLYRITGGR